MFDKQCWTSSYVFLSRRNIKRLIVLKSNTISLEREVECLESYINNVPDNYLVKVYWLWREAVEMIALNRCVTVTSVQCLKTIPTCKTHFSSCLTM